MPYRHTRATQCRRTTKVTFTLDNETVARLGRTARRLGVAKSQVVREAIRVYGEQMERLSEAERDRMLEVFEAVTDRIPHRPREEVEAELAELRSARKRGGRGGAARGP